MEPQIVAGNDGVPPEPDWSALYQDPLDVAVAHDLWGTITRDMKAREIVSASNGHQIKRYVMACVMHDIAARQVIEKGPVVKAKRSSVPQYNPWWSILKDADQRATDHEGELGLSPRRRGMVTKVQRVSKKATASEQYLRSVSK